MLPVNVLLVDNSPEFLKSAARFLSVDPRITIAGCAFSGREALEQVALLHPNLVLMDIAMPGMNGLRAARHIKAQPDAPCVIILTLYDNTEYRAAAAAVGADGFVAKREFGTKLLPLIRTLFTRAEPATHVAREDGTIKGGDDDANSQYPDCGRRYVRTPSPGSDTHGRRLPGDDGREWRVSAGTCLGPEI